MGSQILGIWGIRKFQVGTDLKIRRFLLKRGYCFYFIKFNQCVNSFLDDLVKRLYKVDA